QPEALRKQRPQRAVGEPGSQDRGLARPTLAAHESARDLARRVQLFLVIAREREEVDALAGLLRHHCRAQDHGVALADDHRAVCLFRHAPGLDRDPTPGDVYVFRDYCHAKYLQIWGRNPAARLWVSFLAAVS